MSESPSLVIGPGCKLSGQFDIEGDGLINGSLEGDVRCSNELVVGKQGFIESDVYSNSVRVYGEVSGDIYCRSQITLHSGSKVFGALNAPSVVIEDGANFEGRCQMKHDTDKAKAESLS